jgi:nicotinate-nucleotide adenylyltransferase
MTKIGLLGGTFDPVHNAHLVIAAQAAEQFGLSKVVFIPTGTPIRKINSMVASAPDRLKMLQLACQSQPNFEVSSLEIDRAGVTYTIDTLNYLADNYGPATQLFFITGQDTTQDLPTWKDAAKIAKLVTVLSANRGAVTVTQNHPSTNQSSPALDDFTIITFQIPNLAISSSLIRNKIKAGEDVSSMVPAPVQSYIRKHALYE